MSCYLYVIIHLVDCFSWVVSVTDMTYSTCDVPLRGRMRRSSSVVHSPVDFKVGIHHVMQHASLEMLHNGSGLGIIWMEQQKVLNTFMWCWGKGYSTNPTCSPFSSLTNSQSLSLKVAP